MPSDGKFDGGGRCGLGSVAAAAEAGAEAVLGLRHGVEVSLVSLVVIPSICFGSCGLGSVAGTAEAGAEVVLGLGHGVEASLVSLVVTPSIVLAFCKAQ